MDYIKNIGFENKDQMVDYVKSGGWKKRAGGRGLSFKTQLIFFESDSELKVIINNINTKVNYIEWFKILGDIKHIQVNSSYKNIEINDGIFLYNITIKEDYNSLLLKVNLHDNKIILNKIKKIFYKINFCNKCGVCEAECPSGAIKINPILNVNQNKCIKCHNCLNFDPFGCILARSHNITNGDKSMGKTTSPKLNKYLTFGMREEWLRTFFLSGQEFFNNNNLGNMQLNSFLAWLKDSELINNKGKTISYTDLFIYLREIFNSNEAFVWQIIWINLYYNSNLIKWYLNNYSWGVLLNKNIMVNDMQKSFSNTSKRNIENSIASLINLFKNNNYISDLLRLGYYDKNDKDNYIHKIGSNDIHPIAILYSLYRFANNNKKYKFCLSDLNNSIGSPYLLFGISDNNLKNILLYLNENFGNLIKVEFTADLDNINLKDDITNYYLITKYYA